MRISLKPGKCLSGILRAQWGIELGSRGVRSWDLWWRHTDPGPANPEGLSHKKKVHMDHLHSDPHCSLCKEEICFSPSGQARQDLHETEIKPDGLKTYCEGPSRAVGSRKKPSWEDCSQQINLASVTLQKLIENMLYIKYIHLKKNNTADLSGKQTNEQQPGLAGRDFPLKAQIPDVG